ncbi:MAG: porin [Planctomycetota bacterium]
MSNQSRTDCLAAEALRLGRPRWRKTGELALAVVMLSGLARGADMAEREDDVRDLAEQVRALARDSETWLPPEAEPLETPQPQSPEPSLSIGGALRLNYGWRDYSEQDKDKVGDFGFELFRLDVDGDYDDLGLSVQYRWYAPFEAVHHAYIRYEFSPEWQAQLGIHQVPFGILPYASHSFWFGATYYLGFEDDYDTGLKLLYERGPWDLQLAFYKNPEYIDSSRAERYSFDLVTGGEQANEETNQLNLRLAYDWQPNPCLRVNFGASVEGGQIYNRITEGMGDRFAYALHSDLVYGDWNLQLQWIDYYFRPENPPTVDPQTVQMAAFQFPFLIAADAQVATINLARTLSTDCRLIDTVTCYADFSKVFPSMRDSHSSTQLVLGCLLVAKEHLYVYVDWILGQNMWFVGGPGIGLNRPESTEWQSRLNVNFGLYF